MNYRIKIYRTKRLITRLRELRKIHLESIGQSLSWEDETIKEEAIHHNENI